MLLSSQIIIYIKTLIIQYNNNLYYIFVPYHIRIRCFGVFQHTNKFTLMHKSCRPDCLSLYLSFSLIFYPLLT